MKRLTFTLLLLAAGLTLASSVAQARWSDPQPLPWNRLRSWNVYGYAVSQDTLFEHLEGAKVDTSGSFNLLDADVPNLNQYGVVVTANDSIPFAHVVIYGDSSVTNTVNFKAATCAFQVNWGSNPIGWTTVKTYTCAVTDGVKFWNIPLYESGIVAVGEQSTIGLDGLQLNWQFAPSVRLIFTGASGTSVGTARIRVVKYRAPGSPAGGASTNW